MSKSTVIASIKDEWTQFLAIVEGVPQEKQELPDAIGYWSIAQCLRHVASWDEEIIDIVNIFIKSGDKTLAVELEEKGYDWIKDSYYKEVSVNN